MRIHKIPTLPEHQLVSWRKGTNRFHPGNYECECGEHFPGINAFETHIGEARRARKLAKNGS